MITAAHAAVAAGQDTSAARPQRLTADELVAVAIDCILAGRDFPEQLREPSAISPGLASVEARIARILAGPLYF